MIVGASGSILTQPHGRGDEPLDPGDRRRRLRRRRRGRARRGRASTRGTVRSTSAADAAIQLSYARQVVVVPGYGMAVAQAQHAVRELAKELEKRGVEVKYAIHPVAGRMPGPHERAAGRGRRARTTSSRRWTTSTPSSRAPTSSLVIGANDVTNPAAQHDPGSPIYGMPILNVNESESVIVLKRSMNPRLRGHRQRALLRAEDPDAVRRRQVVGAGGRVGDAGAVAPLLGVRPP